MIRRVLVLLVLSLVLAGSLAYGLGDLTTSRSVELFGDLIAHVDTTERVVALTVDDGPSQSTIDEILCTLASQRVRATLFVVGEALSRSRYLGRLLVEQGMMGLIRFRLAVW